MGGLDKTGAPFPWNVVGNIYVDSSEAILDRRRRKLSKLLKTDGVKTCYTKKYVNENVLKELVIDEGERHGH